MRQNQGDETPDAEELGDIVKDSILMLYETSEFKKEGLVTRRDFEGAAQQRGAAPSTAVCECLALTVD